MIDELRIVEPIAESILWGEPEDPGTGTVMLYIEKRDTVFLTRDQRLQLAEWLIASVREMIQ